MSSYLLDKESEELLIAVIKNDCPTCQLLIPTLDNLGKAGKVTVVLQDEIDFPSEADWVIDDKELEVSWNLNLDSVPTLLQICSSSSPVLFPALFSLFYSFFTGF